MGNSLEPIETTKGFEGVETITTGRNCTGEVLAGDAVGRPGGLRYGSKKGSVQMVVFEAQ